MDDFEPGTLGVLTPDSARTILVISDDGDVAVALRERVERSFALIKDVRPEEAETAFASCIPWPWMLIGTQPHLAEPLKPLLRDRPVLVYWRGERAEGLPGHARAFDTFAGLATAVNTALNQDVAGMKLSVGLGVDLPDGELARSAELQALVAAYPHPFDVPLDAFRSAARVLRSHDIPLRPMHTGNDGMVALAESEGAYA